MKMTVHVRGDHPLGRRHRAGFEFSRTPIEVDVTPAQAVRIVADNWLIVDADTRTVAQDDADPSGSPETPAPLLQDDETTPDDGPAASGEGTVEPEVQATPTPMPKPTPKAKPRAKRKPRTRGGSR